MALSRALLLGLLDTLSLVLASPSNTTIPRSLDKRAAAFQASSSIDISVIQSAVAQGSDVLASYPPDEGSSEKVNIYGDWLDLSGVSAFFFTADMDIDCDGVDYQCPGNTDGQDETSFGTLDARKVPWIVIPEQFESILKKSNPGDALQPNALSAVICEGIMYYAIFGDENGDTPTEVIGEGSLLLGQTCFPDEDISGGSGHDPLDVIYIVFPTEVPSGVGEETIDISALKTLGDEWAEKLVDALQGAGSSGGGGGGGGGVSGGGSGSDQCQTDDDCPGSEVCCVFSQVANICIAQNSCTNSECKSGSSSGTCDGG